MKTSVKHFGLAVEP